MKIIEANGARMPALGFGTWTLNGEQCVDMVSRAIQTGYRHIDTAAKYENEEAVGEGIRASGIARSEIFLTTKVWFTDIGDGALQRSAEASLKRLGVDQVDLLLIHWPSREVSVEESVKALNDAASQGYARHIGLSNHTTSQMEKAVQVSGQPIICNQVEYHPCLNQDLVLEACRKYGMAMTSYCPLYRGGELMSHPAITGPAEAHGKSPAQIVLRWHMQQQNVAAIPRTSSPSHMEQNFQVFDFELTPAEMDAIMALRSKADRICDFDFSPDWDNA
jgi:diketogulonate reductase-like aldo/keto reductase